MSALCAYFGSGYDIRPVQELRGHRDVKTTMIGTHVMNRGPAGAQPCRQTVNKDEVDDMPIRIRPHENKGVMR